MADGGPDFGSSKSRSLPPVFAAQSSGWLSRLSILSQMAPQLDAAIGAHALSLRLVFSSCVITHSSISANRSLPSLPMRSPAACSTRTSALALSSRLERHRLDDLVQPEDAYPLNATPIWRSAPTAVPAPGRASRSRADAERASRRELKARFEGIAVHRRAHSEGGAHNNTERQREWVYLLPRWLTAGRERIAVLRTTDVTRTRVASFAGPRVPVSSRAGPYSLRAVSVSAARSPRRGSEPPGASGSPAARRASALIPRAAVGGHFRIVALKCGTNALHHTHTPAVLDHARTLPQGNRRARPAFAGGVASPARRNPHSGSGADLSYGCPSGGRCTSTSSCRRSVKMVGRPIASLS